MTQKQQGDVLLMRVESIPLGGELVRPHERGHVLAEGEATGHAHTVPAEHGTLTRIGAKLFLTVTAPTKITHEEHREIELEPGVWEVGRVREYDYLTQMTRTVAD